MRSSEVGICLTLEQHFPTISPHFQPSRGLGPPSFLFHLKGSPPEEIHYLLGPAAPNILLSTVAGFFHQNLITSSRRLDDVLLPRPPWSSPSPSIRSSDSYSRGYPSLLAGTPAYLSQSQTLVSKVDRLSPLNLRASHAFEVQTKDLFPEDSMFDLPGPFSTPKKDSREGVAVSVDQLKSPGGNSWEAGIKKGFNQMLSCKEFSLVRTGIRRFRRLSSPKKDRKRHCSLNNKLPLQYKKIHLFSLSLHPLRCSIHCSSIIRD